MYCNGSTHAVAAATHSLSTQSATVVAEVVLNGRVGHLEKKIEKKINTSTVFDIMRNRS